MMKNSNSQQQDHLDIGDLILQEAYCEWLKNEK